METFPDITVLQASVNVFGGALLEIRNQAVLLGGVTLVTWSDRRTEECRVLVACNGREVNDGDMLGTAGKLTVTVTNGQGKSSTAEIVLTDDAVTSLSLPGEMQVDEEVDLLSGVTLAEGAMLVKTEAEMDGQRSEIADPRHFIPEYPGTCAIIFTVSGKNGDTAETRVDNLTIKPLDYNEANINDANMINEKYPRYKNLKQETKDFIYPHLIASYAACNWSKLDNRVHIIM